MSVPKPENVAITNPSRLPYVHDIFIKDEDRNIDKLNWLRHFVDSSEPDGIGAYYGNSRGSKDAQTGLIVNNMAAVRIKQDAPYVYDALVAADTLSGYVETPPLFNAEKLEGVLRKDLWFDQQYLQKGRSYKDHGAAFDVMMMDAAERAQGLKCCTRGNHGIAVARIGKYFGVSTVVYTTVDASEEKKRIARSFGAQVIEIPGTFEDAQAACLDTSGKYARANMIPPFNAEMTMVGQSPIAVNQFVRLPDVKNVVYPIGGGGVISRNAAVLKQINPDINVYGVVHTEANSARLSKLAGRIINIGGAGTFSDGTAVAEPGSKTFPYIEHFVDDIFEVDSPTTATAMRRYHEATGIKLETAAGLGVAAMYEYGLILEGPTIFMLGGANISSSDWEAAMAIADKKPMYV